MKRLCVILFTLLFVLLGFTAAFADEADLGWVKDEKGNWYYYYEEGVKYIAPRSGITAFRKIDGYEYAFDSEGKMLYGWVDEYSTRMTDPDGWKNAAYYLGGKDDGHKRTLQWEKIRVLDYDQEDEYQEYWFYFTSLGKKLSNQAGDYYLEKTIKGQKYAFADDGHMLSGFVEGDNGDGTADASDYKYFSSPESGRRKTHGWFRVRACEDLSEDEYNADEFHTYYAKGNGVLACNEILEIKGKRYLMDELGQRVEGLAVLDTGSDPIQILDTGFECKEDLELYYVPGSGYSAVELYYFGSNGAMRKGRFSIRLGGDTIKLETDENGRIK